MSSELPWYQNGLRFECTQCGKCCTGPPAYVFVSKDEIATMADYLKIPIELFVRKYIRQRGNRYALIEKKSMTHPDDRDCIFLKEKKCLVYPVRPTQCQTFPWWPENLNSKESWQLAAKDCEGISNEAPLVPFEEIEKGLTCQKSYEETLTQFRSLKR